MHHFKPIGEYKLEIQSGNAQFGSNWRYFFCPAWPWNLIDDLEKQQGTSSVQHKAFCIISKPWVNSNWSYSPETLNSGQNPRFVLSCVTLKFDRWLWKTKRHLFYTTSNFVHHFKAMGEFRLQLQSGRSIWVKIGDILFRATLKFDWWHWKTIGHLLYATLSSVHHWVTVRKR